MDKADITMTLLEVLKARQLAYFAHVIQEGADGLKELLQGTISGGKSTRRQKMAFIDKVTEWTNVGEIVHSAANPRIEIG
jgi:hypothetical protein